MYKLLLSWRYLRTRYLALASIVSVMLGVATLIVVNSVMGGFSTKLKERLRGLQAHVTIESKSFDGFPDYEGKIRKVQELVGNQVEAIAPVIETAALLQYQYKGYGEVYTRPVRLIGIDPLSKARVGEFVQYLQNPRHRRDPGACFAQPVAAVHLFGCRRTPPEAILDLITTRQGDRYRPEQLVADVERLKATGWYRQVTVQDYPTRDGVEVVFVVAEPLTLLDALVPPLVPAATPLAPGLLLEAVVGPAAAVDPLNPAPDTTSEESLHVLSAIVGFGIATYRNPKATVNSPDKDVYVLEPGDPITLTVITCGKRQLLAENRSHVRPVMPEPKPAKFIVSDLFKSEMSEYDANLIFVDLKDLQRLRVMQGWATGLQIKLKHYERDAREVVDVLRESGHFHPSLFDVETWENKQGPLLAALSIERGILNVLLFLIIAVAGFGILAIFFMIVVEKTRDIGILKALGASNGGVMGIFLSYGLALGMVGAGLGTALGMTITLNINDLEQFISRTTGQQVFPRDVYYFDEIPTDLQPFSIVMVNLGAILIAVGASVFPALRAAMLHPVRALRYE
jgi:lipoprotein-releasing system permease protein